MTTNHKPVKDCHLKIENTGDSPTNSQSKSEPSTHYANLIKHADISGYHTSKHAEDTTFFKNTPCSEGPIIV